MSGHVTLLGHLKGRVGGILHTQKNCPDIYKKKKKKNLDQVCPKNFFLPNPYPPPPPPQVEWVAPMQTTLCICITN